MSFCEKWRGLVRARHLEYCKRAISCSEQATETNLKRSCTRTKSHIPPEQKLRSRSRWSAAGLSARSSRGRQHIMSVRASVQTGNSLNQDDVPHRTPPSNRFQKQFASFLLLRSSSISGCSVERKTFRKKKYFVIVTACT